MTCDGYARTASSPKSRIRTATGSPTRGYTPPCSSPACTTDCSPPASQSSPTPTRHGHSEPLPTLTRQRSTDSPPQPVSQHDPAHPTQPATNPTQNYGSAAFSPLGGVKVNTNGATVRQA